MKPSVLLAYAILVLAAIAALASPGLAFIYLISAMPIPAIMHFAPIPNDRMKGFLVLTGLAIFAIFFIRPVFLLHFPYLFKFDRLYIPDLDELSRGLMLAGFLSTIFLLAVQFGLQTRRKHRRRGPKVRQEGWLEVRLFDKPMFSIFVVVLAVLFLWLIFFTGYAEKNSGQTQYLRAILPFDLLFPIVMVMVWRHKPGTAGGAFWIGILALLCAATIFRGSKSALFLFLIGLLGLFMYTRGNRAWPVRRVMQTLFVTLIPLPLSVQIANFFRWGANIDLPNKYYTSDIVAPFNLYLLDVITKRLNGFDGQIVAQTLVNTFNINVFSWTNALASALGKLLPGVALGGESMGVAIGRFVNLVDADVDYGGSLGLYGASILMNGPIGNLVFLLVLGFAVGRLARLALALKPGPEQALVFLIAVQIAAHWLISGNFDILISDFVVLLVQILFYGLLFGTARRIRSQPLARGRVFSMPAGPRATRPGRQARLGR